MVQVTKEASAGFILWESQRWTELKIPVTTAARMITDINGQISFASSQHDRIKSARKNQRIIFGEDRSSIIPPFSDGRIRYNVGCHLQPLNNVKM